MALHGQTFFPAMDRLGKCHVNGLYSRQHLTVCCPQRLPVGGQHAPRGEVEVPTVYVGHLPTRLAHDHRTRGAVPGPPEAVLVKGVEPARGDR